MMENIFCPKCHKLTAQINRSEERVELRQNGRVLLSLSAQTKGNTIGLKCPSGHNMKVEIGNKQSSGD